MEGWKSFRAIPEVGHLGFRRVQPAGLSFARFTTSSLLVQVHTNGHLGIDQPITRNENFIGSLMAAMLQILI
jgi:hypothetical protein